ncbi:MAG: hypothetical protein A2X36_17500 [Elusimicrobia bacterium GWA2_69_24]|nr:MAG: hypothetical protein A2X36_17500 [Elusimicrobia bacterium GWA2_69_24]HBL18779.1 hypothetical protein [Elusimicrobiota bacterium]
MRKIRVFYGVDCCWPYALSFPLVLAIYWVESRPGYGGFPRASIAGYAILAAYWAYNVRLYLTDRLPAQDARFLIRWLSFKIVLWLVPLLYLLKEAS